MLPGIKERIEKAMSVTILRETDGIEKQLGFLATIGSVSPFVGLFGTVWGIMNSFSAPSPPAMTPPWPWWRPASPRPCSPPPWAFSPPFRR